MAMSKPVVTLIKVCYSAYVPQLLNTCFKSGQDFSKAERPCGPSRAPSPRISKDRKIRVNAVSPGVIPSPGYRNSLGMTEEQIKQYADSVVGTIPLGRTGTLDEIAKVVSFLASDESSYVTGIELFVDGGMTQI